MCGISGCITRDVVEPSRLHRTLALMNRRGPDHQQVIQFQSQYVVQLLHSRLSIIDIDERAHQPYTIGDYSIVFNGEIYNYLELRSELEQDGIVFQTSSDTEVLLRIFMRDGNSAFAKMEGMWALAIYDRVSQTLTLSRDRFGEKPLYLFERGDELFFGSEIKFIQALVGKSFDKNMQQLARYLTMGFRSLYKQNETFFVGVNELPSGSTLTVDSTGRRKLEKYWRPKFEVDQTMSLSDAIEGVRQRLIRSVELRLRSDVPVAFCLSGGVDSASLASIAVKVCGADISTFSIIDSDQRYDESRNILTTVKDLNCNHLSIYTSRDGFIERLHDLVRYHDSPLATSSYYVHSFLSEAISKAGFKVSVSGTGADELLTGYYDHFLLHLYEMRGHVDYPLILTDYENHVFPLIRNPLLQDPDKYTKNPLDRDHLLLNQELIVGCLRQEFIESFQETHYSDSLLRNRMANELFHEIVPVILHEDDLNSMYYSVENRSPYLDTDLFEFVQSIPTTHLIKDGYGKALLRYAVKGVLNDQVRLDRTKKGFNVSLASLVDLESADTRAYLFEQGPLLDIVDPDKLLPIMQNERLSNSLSKFLFNIFNCKLFLET